MNVAAPVIPPLPVPSFMSSATPSVDVGPPKSFLLYGDTGTRKTTMVGELIASGRFNRALAFDIDNGTETWAADPAIKAAVDDGRLTIIGIDSAMDADAFAKLDGGILEICGAYRDQTGTIRPNPNIPDFGFDLFLLDTVNLAQTVAVKHFLTTTFTDKGKPDTLAAWGKVGIWTDEIVRLLHNTKRFTSALVMHPMTVESKTGSVKVKPKLGGGMKDSISTIPSLVAYLAFEQHPDTGVKSLVATVGDSVTHDAKNRYRLPEKIYDFNLTDLYRTIDKITKAHAVGIATPEAPAPTPPATVGAELGLAQPSALPTIPAAVAA